MAEIIVRLLARNDSAILKSAADEVFDNPIDPVSTAEFLADPRHHIVAALDENRLVGFASAVHYVHPDKPTELWINEVGVVETYQRRGIARRLMQALFDKARALGCKEAWVLTEHENSPARALYKAAGGQEDSVAYFTFDLDPRR